MNKSIAFPWGYPKVSPSKLTAATLAVFLFVTGLVVIRPAAAAGTPLLAIGIDVVSGTSDNVTYKINVRNAGNGDATNVRVSMMVPPTGNQPANSFGDTTFESSSPPASPVDGSPAGASPTCDNGGVREPKGTNCQWAIGTLAAGTQSDITVILNLLAPPAGLGTDQTLSVTASATGVNPATSAATNSPSDTDPSLARHRLVVGEDTFVNINEPLNTNHGQCPILTANGTQTITSYVRSTTSMPGSIEKFLGAELIAVVAASEYSEATPGSLALHPVTSGAWTEGASTSCGPGTLGSGDNARTGSAPATTSTPSSTTSVKAANTTIKWNVTGDLDGAAERAAFQGWQIRNASGAGSVDLHSGEVTDSANQPKVVLTYVKPEIATCIDLDPETNIAFPTSEQTLTAVVYDGNPAGRIVSGSNDACNGTPVAGKFVDWTLDADGSPDAYFSNQAGTPVPKSGTALDAGPDLIRTTTDQFGRTFAGVRLGNVEFYEGENRVAACIDNSPSGSDGCPGVPEPESCTVLTPCTAPRSGEGDKEDDVSLRWSPTAPTPTPEPTPTPQGPPTVSSFSPTSGPIGTSVVLSGSNFTGASAVRFNGIAATFTVNSPNQITTTVPNAATDGPISVQNAAGTGVSAANFDVTPGGTPTPTRSPTATATSSPSGSGTVSPGGTSAVNLSLSPSKEKSVAFSEVSLSGALSSDNALCAQPGTTIELLKRDAGSTEFTHLAFVSTGVGGLFEHKVSPEANTVYAASLRAHDGCDAAMSTPVTVLIGPDISIKSTTSKVDIGRRFWVTGKVLPEHQLAAVTLWRKKAPGQFEKLATDYLDGASRYSFAVHYSWKKSPKSIFFVRWRSTDADHISGKSPRLIIERA